MSTYVTIVDLQHYIVLAGLIAWIARLLSWMPAATRMRKTNTSGLRYFISTIIGC